MKDTISIDEYRALPTEHAEQCAFIEWCVRWSGQHPDLAWVAAVPNGGKRSIGVARKLKAEGVRAGYPDLLLDVARNGYYGWRCELKRVGGSVNKKTQTPWHERLRQQGYCVDVCVGWEAAARAACAYLGIDARGML